jgi:hypothetical protein
MTTENAIDDKKIEETDTTNSWTKLKSFALNYTYSLIVTIFIIIFIIGSLGLYTTKVAQSNILPDNVDLEPFCNLAREVKPIYVDLNIMRPTMLSDYKNCYSQKAVFNSEEYLESFKNGFLCYFKKRANPTKTLSNIPLYFSKVYDNIVATNFWVINSLFLYLNYLPEWLIMVFYGFFGFFLWFGFYFFNIMISIFYHIVNIPQLFRSKDKNSDIWEEDKNISLFRITKLIIFCVMWIPLFISTFFITPIVLTIYSCFAPLFATYTINGKNKLNVFNFITK